MAVSYISLYLILKSQINYVKCKKEVFFFSFDLRNCPSLSLSLSHMYSQISESTFRTHQSVLFATHMLQNRKIGNNVLMHTVCGSKSHKLLLTPKDSSDDKLMEKFNVFTVKMEWNVGNCPQHNYCKLASDHMMQLQLHKNVISIFYQQVVGLIEAC